MEILKPYNWKRRERERERKDRKREIRKVCARKRKGNTRERRK
jgi:hypothetical protein